MTISNDGATIMKLLEVVHPAAKVLVDISLSQDTEVRYLPRYRVVSTADLSLRVTMCDH